MPDLILAGAAIVDVPVVPADASVFSRVSTPAEHIMLTTGGDAMNEAMVLSRLGKQVRLITRIGTDDAGRYIKPVHKPVLIRRTFSSWTNLPPASTSFWSMHPASAASSPIRTAACARWKRRTSRRRPCAAPLSFVSQASLCFRKSIRSSSPSYLRASGSRACSCVPT